MLKVKNIIKTKKFNLKIEKDAKIGDILKQYRQKNRIKIEDIAKFFNVKKQDIIDLEDNSIFEKKPKSYAISLCKTYQKLLQIEDEILKEHFKELSNRHALEKEQISQNFKFILKNRQIIGIILLILISYLVFFYDFSNNMTTDLIIEKLY